MHSIGRRSLDDARVALAEYFAIYPPPPTPTLSESALRTEGQDPEDNEIVPTPRAPVSSANAEVVDIDGSLNALVKMYARVVDVLRERRERELLTEALNDLGDLHVSKRKPLCEIRL